MKTSFIKRKHWAETTRLYSGLLEDKEREKFIKEIANSDILLAAECRATSFSNEDEIDSYLAFIATTQANNFKSSNISAKGLMALAELNRFDEISKIFSSIPEGRTRQIHFEVVSRIIYSGSELQILNFITILSRFNRKLLNRALDRIFDSKIIFSAFSRTKGLEILDIVLIDEDYLLAAKIICIFSLKVKLTNIEDLLDALFESLEIDYADKFISLYNIAPSDKILKSIPNYLKSDLSKPLVVILLDIFKKFNFTFDLNEVRLRLSTNLNPLVKQYLFEFESDIPISGELAYEICIQNIQIASKASILFAMQMMEKFDLGNRIKFESLIDSLLIDPKYQRIELAYKLIQENNLTEIYSYKFLFDLLITLKNPESFLLAKNIIKSHFEPNLQNKYFEYLCCILVKEGINNKIAKDILFNEAQAYNLHEKIIEGRVYYGQIIYKNSKTFKFAFLNNQTITQPIKGRAINVNSFIKFKITKLSDKISESQISILDLDYIETLASRYYLDQFFVGQIVELNIKRIENRRLILNNFNFSEYNFIINKEELSHNCNGIIPETFKINQKVKAKIIGVNIAVNELYCSVRQILKKESSRQDGVPKDELLIKIERLKNLYSNK